MRIRLPFAAIFTLIFLLAAYTGLTPNSTTSSPIPINDKVLHLVAFFALTLTFYWILDTTRRRTLNFTLVVCTLGLGIGSEFAQAILPNGRLFDIFDVVANVVGSLSAVGLCSLYHKRMLERKRARRGYGAVPGEDVGGEEDLELGESTVGVGSGGQEEGVVVAEEGIAERSTTLEEEVDNWDENAEDPWDEDDMGDIGAAGTGKDGKRAD
ncbi:hypothetical protein QBC34DRAFT_168949 [Podospora aff. communis PSN243]|uniref:VanZ-like domain-containing protein n=1 Tax=Podospora aff. communis PSN243 TaxID=3040156 RepID=A0AAV9GA75_9PEZI|nr:hypothetical protein QBC34DRAFT_168949 [Podospora aff. communis PSN243]